LNKNSMWDWTKTDVSTSVYVVFQNLFFLASSRHFDVLNHH
jgi:hypothetical protein